MDGDRAAHAPPPFAMDVDYELSQQLLGHDNQVRCVCCIGEDTLLSGGLDAQILMWKRPSANEQFVLAKTLVHHSDWVNQMAASSESPGSFYSCSKDRTAFLIDAEGNPVRQFVGHEDNVCSVAEMGKQLVTGSWDGTAKVWDVESGELRHSLDAGPPRAVAVAVLPTGEIVTGAQDASLRLFRGSECTKKIDNAHGAIIRSISVSSTHIVTASNDQLLKIWSLDLTEMGNLPGHQNFVYGVRHAADNQSLFSVSEDCTLKRWSLEDSSCKQSILHAASVWQAAPMPNGDVATCCEDKIVRIWTTDPARMASEAERQTNQEMAQSAALTAAQKGSSSTSMPDATDVSEMPTTVGKKNGEIKCFKDGDKVFAYSWNAGARIWDQIGEVTGSAASKKHYPGDMCFPAGEYDFVFDVELGTDRKALLPYNKGQNPMAVAEAFCARESIRKDNIDQVRKFIETNGGGGGTATVGPASGAPAQQAAPKAAPAPGSSMFPLSTPLQFKDGKYDPLQKKILEFNEQVLATLKIEGLDLQYFNDAVEKLRDKGIRAEFKQVEVEVIHEKLIEWPAQFLFPVMDLWRLYALHPASSDMFKGSDRGAPILAKVCGFLTPDAPDPLKMCTVRYIANLFAYQTNRTAVYNRRDIILKAVAPCLQSQNKNVKLASATVLLNFAMVLHELSYPPKPWDAETAMEVARLSFRFLETSGADDGDAQQRAALTIGTLLPRDKENGGAIAKACNEAGFLARLAPIEDKVTSKVLAELRARLS